jgi:hypothetical protein
MNNRSTWSTSLRWVRWTPALLLAAAVGCGLPQDSVDTDTDALLSPGGASLYDVNKGIRVCFEQTGGSYDELNRNVRDAVVSEWTAKVGVLFTGFRPCAEGPADVRVSYFDCVKSDSSDCPNGVGSPHTEAIGRPSNGAPNVVHLRSGYSNHWMKNNCGGWFGSLPDCTRGYAIHEFGHILGFSHEQAHPDSTCGDKEVFPGGWICPGGYDPGSVMNYCSASTDRRDWYRHGLSGRDIACARDFFFRGTPPQRREACFYDCCAGDTACEKTQGPPWCFPPGEVNYIGPTLNDRFARVELRGGASVSGYSSANFVGSSWTWTQSEGCMGSGLRDGISSLKVQ